MYEFNVTLYRDSLSTPWGIRIEGGLEFGKPLTIQRVLYHLISSFIYILPIRMYILLMKINK